MHVSVVASLLVTTVAQATMSISCVAAACILPELLPEVVRYIAVGISAAQTFKGIVMSCSCCAGMSWMFICRGTV